MGKTVSVNQFNLFVFIFHLYRMVAAGPFNQFKIVSDQSNLILFPISFKKEQISSIKFDTNDTINIKIIC